MTCVVIVTLFSVVSFHIMEARVLGLKKYFPYGPLRLQTASAKPSQEAKGHQLI
jgi:hypothetical protein